MKHDSHPSILSLPSISELVPIKKQDRFKIVQGLKLKNGFEISSFAMKTVLALFFRKEN